MPLLFFFFCFFFALRTASIENKFTQNMEIITCRGIEIIVGYDLRCLFLHFVCKYIRLIDTNCESRDSTRN